MAKTFKDFQKLTDESLLTDRELIEFALVAANAYRGRVPKRLIWLLNELAVALFEPMEWSDEDQAYGHEALNALQAVHLSKRISEHM